MTIINPSSTSTTLANDHAIDITVNNTIFFLREGVYLQADGTGANAINATAAFTGVIDGYAVSGNSNAVAITSNTELTIGEEGVVIADANGIFGTGSDNEIVNNGNITTNSAGIYLGLSGHTVTNAGSINNGSG